MGRKSSPASLAVIIIRIACLTACVPLQEREKYSEKLDKWKLDDVHKFMDLLDMPRGSGDKKAGPFSLHAARHAGVGHIGTPSGVHSQSSRRPAADLSRNENNDFLRGHSTAAVPLPIQRCNHPGSHLAPCCVTSTG